MGFFLEPPNPGILRGFPGCGRKDPGPIRAPFSDDEGIYLEVTSKVDCQLGGCCLEITKFNLKYP